MNNEQASDYAAALERSYARLADEVLLSSVRFAVLARMIAEVPSLSTGLKARVREVVAQRQRDAAVLARLLELHPELAAEVAELRADFEG